MRISDWSSDVCSSDLVQRRRPGDAVLLQAGMSLKRDDGRPEVVIEELVDDGALGRALVVANARERRHLNVGCAISDPVDGLGKTERGECMSEIRNARTGVPRP